MHECPLHFLLFHIFCDINRFHGERVKLCMVHTGCKRSRRRIKILHLIRYKAIFFKKYRKFRCLAKSAPRVGGYQIWYQILFEPQFFIRLFIFSVKIEKNIRIRLSHIVEDLR